MPPEKNSQNQQNQTAPLNQKPPRAFIGYIAIALVIIVAGVWGVYGRTPGRITEGNGGSDASSTISYSSSTASSSTPIDDRGLNSNQNPGPNDSNGSGQNEPSKPVASTGYQSPVLAPLYQGHIVGGQLISQKVLIYPWAVLEDSRCPIDVQCIQAGRVRLGVRFTNPETKVALIADQVLEVGQSIEVNGLEITLLEVKPVTKSTIKIKDNEYRFIFGITKIK